MKRLLVYLKDYKKESILGPLFKMLEASFELLVPLVMASVIDVGITKGDKGYIIKMCLILVLLGIIGLVCSITAQYFAAKAAVGFAAKMKHALFGHIQKLSFSEMDKLGTPTLITRMTSDANQVQNGVNMVLRLFLRSPFVVFGAMIMAFTIDVKAALIFVITIPVLSIIVFGIMVGSIPLYKKVQAGLDRILSLTRENLTGVRVIRAFNKEEEEIKRFETNSSLLLKVQLIAGRISALMNPITYVVINVATAALLWSGALKVDSGSLTQGEVWALVNYMSQILVELVKLASLIITITKALACANRIEQVFQTEAGLVNGLGVKETREKTQKEFGASVVFDHVCLTYQGAGAESLTDISFQAKPGQTIGIIGGTGSGKSSLVHMIPRFYDATKGKILIDGEDVREYDIAELRKKIGIVMQKAVLFRGTIEENLKIGSKDAGNEELWDALRISQSEEFVKEKDGAMKAAILQGGKNLSGGQKQRLTIARALARKPRILILDDSASALDYATDARLRKAIREMKDAPTVFIVSQRASSIRYADQIIVLDDGCVANIGTHDTLMKECSIYQEIYDSQCERKQGAAV